MLGSLKSPSVLPATLERATHNQFADVGEARLLTLKKCAVTESELFNLPIDRPAAQFEVCQVTELVHFPSNHHADGIFGTHTVSFASFLRPFGHSSLTLPYSLYDRNPSLPSPAPLRFLPGGLIGVPGI
jgi:hypothetical protein